MLLYRLAPRIPAGLVTGNLSHRLEDGARWKQCVSAFAELARIGRPYADRR
jgi:hypothetical protein